MSAATARTAGPIQPPATFLPTLLLVLVASISLRGLVLCSCAQGPAPPLASVGAGGNLLSAHWLNAQESVRQSVMPLLTRRAAELAKAGRLNLVRHGDSKRKEIALTFDDGPHPDYTPRLLTVLAECKVEATFFVVGRMAEEYPDLVRAELASGHTVGNHTYHHLNLNRLPSATVAVELKACGNVLAEITGAAPRFFRPPGGDYSARVGQVAAALGYSTVFWTVNSRDCANASAGAIQRRLLSHATPGGVFLLHDGRQATLDALPGLIEALKSRGYRFVTLDEMQAHR